MTDCVGKELSVGDKVVCADMKYADLLIGEIIGFTPKKARVRYQRSAYGEAYGATQKEQLKETYQIFKYEEVRHGEWNIRSEIYKMIDDVDEELFVECPFCHRQYNVPYLFDDEKILEYAREEYPYCHCGAKMDGKGEQ